MDDLNDVLEINRLDLLPAYRSLGWDMGNLSVEDTNTIMRVLSGEQTLIPGAEPHRSLNRSSSMGEFRDDMEADTRSSYKWVIDHNMQEFLL